MQQSLSNSSEGNPHQLILFFNDVAAVIFMFLKLSSCPNVSQGYHQCAMLDSSAYGYNHGPVHPTSPSVFSSGIDSAFGERIKV
jgi:hypothetical protein